MLEHLYGRGYSHSEIIRRKRNSSKQDLIFNYKKALKDLTSLNSDDSNYKRLGLDLSVSELDSSIKIEGHVTPIDKFTRMDSLYYSLELDMGNCVLTESVSNGNGTITDKTINFDKEFIFYYFELFHLYKDVYKSKESFTLGSLTAYLLKLLTIESAKLDGEKALTEVSSKFLDQSFRGNKYNLLTTFDIYKFDNWETIFYEPEIEYNLLENSLTIDLLIMPIEIDEEMPFILTIKFGFDAKFFNYSFEKITNIEPNIKTVTIDEFSCSFNSLSDFSKYGLNNLLNEASKNNLESSNILTKVIEFIADSFWL